MFIYLHKGITYLSKHILLHLSPGMQINVKKDTFTSRLEEVSEAGFKYIELKFRYGYGLTDKSDSEINEEFAAMHKQIEAKGIKVWSVHLPFDDETWNNIGGTEEVRKQSVEHLTRVMRLCAKHFTPCRNFVTHASKGSLSARSESVSQARKSIEEMIPVARELGVRICIENLVSSLCYSPEELEAVCKGYPDIYYTFDIGHANCLGYDVVDFLKKDGTRLGTVHIHDTIFNSGDDSHRIVGNGDISCWGEVYRSLLETNRYRGVFMFEPKDNQSARDIMASYERIVSDFVRLFQEH